MPPVNIRWRGIVRGHQCQSLRQQGGRHGSRRKKALLARKFRTPHKERPFLTRRRWRAPHVLGRGQRQKESPPRARPSQTFQKPRIRHTQGAVSPPRPPRAAQQVPRIVHTPDDGGNPRRQTRLREPPVGIKPPQIDGKQQRGRMGRRLPDEGKERRAALFRRILQHAPAQLPGGMAQFQMQQAALIPRQNQQRRRELCRTRRQRAAGRLHAPQQRPPECGRETQPRTVEMTAAARRQRHGLLRGDLTPGRRRYGRAGQGAARFRALQPVHGAPVRNKRQRGRLVRPETQQQAVALFRAGGIPLAGIPGKGQRTSAKIGKNGTTGGA